jgi:hypothetical protein
VGGELASPEPVSVQPPAPLNPTADWLSGMSRTPAWDVLGTADRPAAAKATTSPAPQARAEENFMGGTLLDGE